MPVGGHGDESFSVNGVRFAYSDYHVTSSFHQSQSHGGPIREGLGVRICYLEDRTDHPILGLALATSPPEPRPTDPGAP